MISISGNIFLDVITKYSGNPITYDCLLPQRTRLNVQLCGLVVRVSGYRFRGPGFDSRPYQIFREVGCLERGPLGLVKTIEKLLE
jgi:hypothetical protein